MRPSRAVIPTVVTLILTFAGPALAQANGPRGFAGEYVMEGWGLDPRGAGYRGSCSVLGDGPAYRVSCINSDTGIAYVGRGLALGDTLSILVGEEMRGDDEWLGVDEYLVLYRRQANGVLDGLWISERSGTAGVETLTPTP